MGVFVAVNVVNLYLKVAVKFLCLQVPNVDNTIQTTAHQVLRCRIDADPSLFFLWRPM